MSFTTAIEQPFADFQKYGPAALSAVQGVEAAVGAGKGQTKKQIALAAVLAAVHAGETVPIVQVQVISAVIDTLVSVLNAIGLFRKATPIASVIIPKPVPKQAA